MARTGGFYNLTPNEADQLIAQAERDPVSLDEFFSVFRVSLPSADGTFRYRYYRADVLWRSIMAVFAQKRELVYPEIQAPVWYEDWYELHNQYDPNGPVPPEVNQLLRLANYNPAAPPAWALPTPAPAPAPADDEDDDSDSESPSDTEVPEIMNDLAQATLPYESGEASSSEAPHDGGLGPQYPANGSEWEQVAYMWGQEAVFAGFQNPLTQAPLPQQDATTLEWNQYQVVANILGNIRELIHSFVTNPSPYRRDEIMNKLGRGLIFKYLGPMYVASGHLRDPRIPEVVADLVDVFVDRQRLSERLALYVVRFLGNFVEYHDGAPVGLIGDYSDEGRQVIARFRDSLLSWEGYNLLELRNEWSLQLAVDGLLARDPRIYADPVDTGNDEPYGPLEETNDYAPWVMPHDRSDRTLNGPLNELSRLIHGNGNGTYNGSGAYNEEQGQALQNALDAVPFPLPLYQGRHKNPWPLIGRDRGGQGLIRFMIDLFKDPMVDKFTKIRFCKWLLKFVREYPQVGRHINKKDITTRFELRMFAGQLFRRSSVTTDVPPGDITAVYELAAYLQVDHDDKLLFDGFRKATNRNFWDTDLINSAVSRARGHLAAVDDMEVPSHLRLYKDAWWEDGRLQRRIDILWQTFKIQTREHRADPMTFSLPYLASFVTAEQLLALTHNPRGWTEQALNNFIEYQGQRYGNVNGEGVRGARDLLEILREHYEAASPNPRRQRIEQAS